MSMILFKYVTLPVDTDSSIKTFYNLKMRNKKSIVKELQSLTVVKEFKMKLILRPILV